MISDHFSSNLIPRSFLSLGGKTFALSRPFLHPAVSRSLELFFPMSHCVTDLKHPLLYSFAHQTDFGSEDGLLSFQGDQWVDGQIEKELHAMITKDGRERRRMWMKSGEILDREWGKEDKDKKEENLAVNILRARGEFSESQILALPFE
jgi:hypothetical protein